MADVLTLPRPENWKVKGLCNDRDQQFYAAEDVKVSNAKLREAADACTWCPVLTQCREFTLKERPVDGVWAGEVFAPSTRLAQLRHIAKLLGVEYTPPPGGVRAHQPCGTVAAYKRHLTRKEPVCGPCRAAQQADSRQAKLARKQRKS